MSCCIIAGLKKGFGGGEPVVVFGVFVVPVVLCVWAGVVVLVGGLGVVFGFAAPPKPPAIPGNPPAVGPAPISCIKLDICSIDRRVSGLDLKVRP